MPFHCRRGRRENNNNKRKGVGVCLLIVCMSVCVLRASVCVFVCVVDMLCRAEVAQRGGLGLPALRAGHVPRMLTLEFHGLGSRLLFAIPPYTVLQNTHN